MKKQAIWQLASSRESPENFLPLKSRVSGRQIKRKSYDYEELPNYSHYRIKQEVLDWESEAHLLVPDNHIVPNRNFGIELVEKARKNAVAHKKQTPVTESQSSHNQAVGQAEPVPNLNVQRRPVGRPRKKASLDAVEAGVDDRACKDQPPVQLDSDAQMKPVQHVQSQSACRPEKYMTAYTFQCNADIKSCVNREKDTVAVNVIRESNLGQHHSVGKPVKMSSERFSDCIYEQVVIKQEPIPYDELQSDGKNEKETTTDMSCHSVDNKTDQNSAIKFKSSYLEEHSNSNKQSQLASQPKTMAGTRLLANSCNEHTFDLKEHNLVAQCRPVSPPKNTTQTSLGIGEADRSGNPRMRQYTTLNVQKKLLADMRHCVPEPQKKKMMRAKTIAQLLEGTGQSKSNERNVDQTVNLSDRPKPSPGLQYWQVRQPAMATTSESNTANVVGNPSPDNGSAQQLLVYTKQAVNTNIWHRRIGRPKKKADFGKETQTDNGSMPCEDSVVENRTVATYSRPTKRDIKETNQMPVSTASRSSGRQIKRKSLDVDYGSPVSFKHHRKCERVGCPASVPICFASATNRCVGSNYTSRWCHLSAGEHFCNECFEYFYRSHKEGYIRFTEWKRLWSENGKTEPSLRAFMMDQWLPYWVRCTANGCGKWRQLPRDMILTREFLVTFTCAMSGGQKKDSSPCLIAEDLRAASATEPDWIALLTQPSLLRDSPSAVFLSDYYPDCVGNSPTCYRCRRVNRVVLSPSNKEVYDDERGDTKDFSGEMQTGSSRAVTSISFVVPGVAPCMQPFCQPSDLRKAFCIRPDVMEPYETEAFLEYAREQVMYLGLRNLIVALWTLNPTEWLTVETVSKHILCRGLVRIRCIYEAERILKFFTRRGIVNYGLVRPPSPYSQLPPKAQEKVLILGAGISGLGAASHLRNLGVDVTVLEGRNRIGGRICDDTSFGICVGLGAQIVTGVLNNPISIMSVQGGVEMQTIRDRCDLYTETGVVAPLSVDQRVDFHFNAMLDAVAEWRSGKTEDVSLQAKFQQLHQSFVKETGLAFSKEEDGLLQFHISNLEYACGANLRYVSALHWDQNESFPQFAGEHTLLSGGYSQLLSLLADGIDTRLGVKVKKIDYGGDEVVVTSTDGSEHRATRVVVTFPLAVLQAGRVEFSPPLPKRKQDALQGLGAGVIEKVALQFSYRFWNKIEGADLFGHIPVSAEQRGLFSVFYDLTPKIKSEHSSSYVLMTYLSGDAVDATNMMSDEEIVQACMKVLRGIFSDQENQKQVPDPIRWVVTHWQQDPFAGMAYSYVRVGGNGEAYDILAESIDDKVYFAGEATNRPFPQTTTGAYLSGVREACRIVDHVVAAHKC